MIRPAVVLFALAFCAVGMIQQAKPPPAMLWSIDRLKSRNQPRKAFTQAELEALGKSLQERQLQALVCLRDGTLICGERRLRAAKLVGLTHLLVQVIEEDLTETQIRIYQLVENLQRADLTPQEQVHGALELMASTPGMTRKECAAKLHVDPAMVTRWCSYQEVVASVQQAFDQGRITVKDMVAIGALAKEQQEGLLNLKLSSGLSASEVETQSRKKRNGNGAAEVKLSKIPCDLPNGIKVVLSGPEMSLDDAVEALSEALKAAKEAQGDGLTAKTWSAQMRDKSKPG